MTVLLQSNHNNVASGATTLNVVFLNPVTPGSLLVCYAGSTAGARTFTAADGVNGAYNVDIQGANSTAILSFPNTAAGTPTVTITMSGAGSEITGIVEEWGGVQTVTPFDKSASVTGASNTTTTIGPTATLTQANELCLATCHLGGTSGTTFAVQSPFTPSPASPWPALNASLIAAGNLIQSSTSPVSATFNWTTTQNFRGCVATYKTVQLGQIAPYYNRKNVLYFI